MDGRDSGGFRWRERGSLSWLEKVNAILHLAIHWAGGRSLSAYIAQDVKRQLLADRRRRYLAELDEEFGPLTEEEREEGQQLWNEEV